MPKVSEYDALAAASADAEADFVPVVEGSGSDRNKRMTLRALWEAGLSGTRNLRTDVTIDGTSTYAFVIEDCTTLSIEGVNASLTGISSLYLDSANTTLRGVQALNIRTPRVHTFEALAGQLLALTDAEDGTVDFSTVATIDALLIGWAAAGSFVMTEASRDGDGVVTSASVAWPDGSTGVYTRTTKNEDFNAVDAFTVTHSGTGKTVTQGQITRDSNGRVTAQPLPTIA